MPYPSPYTPPHLLPYPSLDNHKDDIGNSAGALQNQRKSALSLKSALKNLTLGRQNSSRNGSECSRSNRKQEELAITTVNQRPPLKDANLQPVAVPTKPVKKNSGIGNLIELDTSYLNFGSFYPGKIFKCSLGLTNNTAHSRSLFVAFDDETFMFTREELLRTIAEEDLPDAAYPVPNSEQIYHCWEFMVDVENKSFDKSVIIELPPRSSIQLGTVIKSPCIKKPKSLYALIKVALSEDDPMSSLLDKGKDTLAVLARAEISMPKLQCCKELFHDQAGLKVIPLVAKLSGGGQRLRVPFKNGGAKDVELMLDVTGFPGKEPFAEYKCVPSSVRIPSNSVGYITIGVSIWRDDVSQKKEQRVLLVKIKDTSILYPYVLDCFFIP
eukprot:TRINITY_DN3406_c0_g6_i1.p1 TRINITY_DN3406_c0_g6~~TRINITY_DN3406_c0_g6_i1.p1  ORF type:complete len:383 (+),score=89.95 TRINITY_DN3406_c0_g6_i1:102-1250(+)